MARSDRPLSPHLDVYAWQISNTLSILHRITGIALSIGALALVGWLVSIVSGPAAYASVNGFFAGPIGALMLFGWTFCIFYHLANGIRHLGWDVGLGFDKALARQTGWLTVIAAVIMTAATWIAAFAV
ncbi:MAG: succinate dehydrogenase, cytochrome b556 subunit [Gammaproteobacteria bacterium]|nr:succinate dehydrogenase, cytochrome b556 subunit [Gammaproteobacteria bacterium]